jgi:hypothetical protein
MPYSTATPMKLRPLSKGVFFLFIFGLPLQLRWSAELVYYCQVVLSKGVMPLEHGISNIPRLVTVQDSEVVVGDAGQRPSADGPRCHHARWVSLDSRRRKRNAVSRRPIGTIRHWLTNKPLHLMISDTTTSTRPQQRPQVFVGMEATVERVTRGRKRRPWRIEAQCSITGRRLIRGDTCHHMIGPI